MEVPNIFTGLNAEEVKKCECDIVRLCIKLGVISGNFTGSVTFHFNVGNVCDYEKLERGLRRKLSK